MKDTMQAKRCMYCGRWLFPVIGRAICLECADKERLEQESNEVQK